MPIDNRKQYVKNRAKFRKYCLTRYPKQPIKIVFERFRTNEPIQSTIIHIGFGDLSIDGKYKSFEVFDNGWVDLWFEPNHRLLPLGDRGTEEYFVSIMNYLDIRYPEWFIHHDFI